MVSRNLFILLFSFVACFQVSRLQSQEIMPPVLDWQGASELLILPDGHPWITVAEQTGFRRTSNHAETLEYLERLCSSSPLLRMAEIGESANHLPIPMIIASSEIAFEADKVRRSGKLTFLAQACIHAGEVDGKDAGMMLLRDIAQGRAEGLLDDVNFLFIPILNPDGHERASRFNRPNQRGPENMGWRTNAGNLNLNRDYTKLDTREIQAVMRVIKDYAPDLYMDIHVTDGADYQYDITYGFIGDHGYSPAASSWLEHEFRPLVDAGMRHAGHIPGPLMFAIGGGNFSRGNIDYMFSPIFSHAYGDLRHLPTILVENHSLKPYKQRVLGTYVLLDQTLRALGKKGRSLNRAIEKDYHQGRDSLPVSWQVPQFATGTGRGQKQDPTPPDSMLLLGIRSETDSSAISRAPYLRWMGEPITRKIPLYTADKLVKQVLKSKTYFIPPAWSEVIEILDAHGIEMTYLESPSAMTVSMYRLMDIEIGNRVFEGRIKVSGRTVSEERLMTFPANTAIVDTDQPLGDLACYLLEPEAPESLFRWGFFNGILSRTEYMEAYILEPMMSQMLKGSVEIRTAYEEKMRTDSAFANSPRAIRNWFYAQSPFYDDQYLLYPVGMIR